MYIHLDTPGRLILDLNQSDLAELGLTYQTMSYTSPRTRTALQQLLTQAAAQTGFDPGEGKLLIEVFPAPEMGCTIRFTRLGTKRLRRVEDAVRLYEFHDSEALMSAMAQLYAGGHFGGSLYACGEKYRLLFPCKSPSAADSLLCEFSTPLGRNKNAAAFTKEHFRKLCSDPPRKIGGIIAQKRF